MRGLVSLRARVGAESSHFARAVAARHAEVLDLTLANPRAVGLGPSAETIKRVLAIVEGIPCSAEAMGMQRARIAVARHLGLGDTAAARTMLTASTSEAYAFLFKLLADPGDEVLVPSPSYPLFDYLARYEDLRAVPYPLVYDGLWHIDLAALEACITSRTRAIVVVAPNNPTGSLLSLAEIRALDSLGLPVLCDEVFAEYTIAPRGDACASALQHAHASPWFVMGGTSKSLGLPEWKLGWTVLQGGLAAQRDALWDALETIADTYLSVSGVAQEALPALLAEAPVVQQAIRDRLLENLSLIDAALRGSMVSRLHVEGGWSCILRLPALQDDEAWALSLLQDAHVLVQPGYFYELGPAPHLVLSLLTPPDVMQHGIERLAAHVAAVSQH